MKKIILLFALQLIALTSFAQCYLAVSTADVNMREGPSTEYDIIKRLQKGTDLYVDTDESIDGWYLVVDIRNDIEGYVSSKYVRLKKSVNKSNSTSIQRGDMTYDYNPTLHIKNSTSTSMSLRINSTTYKLSPYETTTVTMDPGRFTYRASAPGVVPISGEHSLESNYNYEWEFYIVTRRR